MLYDLFICHANEDKESLVRPLAEALRDQRVEVWYDEFSLKPGDSLRRAIDRGLASSRLGVVVLSKHFFAKAWPQWELDGLVQRELAGPDPVIIPIWHGVGHTEVLAYSPPLADKMAISSNLGSEGVARELLKVVHPQGSTLLVARDLVIDFGGKPPVVTDDWWLDAVEVSASNPVEGTFQEHSGWGRWGFPLPPRDNSPQERGERLGWAAMQMAWMSAAREQRISQVTRPEEVLGFVSSQPGLEAACDIYPAFLAAYAPQLVIPGFSGQFTSHFDKALVDARAGSSRDVTRGREVLSIEPEWIALRHPKVASLDAATVACNFVSGYGIDFGPDAKAFAVIDYVAWFLSSASGWLPATHRQLLTSGLKEWAVWPWGPREGVEGTPVPETRERGSLQKQLLDEVNQSRLSRSDFRLSTDSSADLTSRLAHSADVLRLSESAEELADQFLRVGFIEEWLKQEHARRQIGEKRPVSRSSKQGRRQSRRK